MKQLCLFIYECSLQLLVVGLKLFVMLYHTFVLEMKQTKCCTSKILKHPKSVKNYICSILGLRLEKNI